MKHVYTLLLLVALVLSFGCSDQSTTSAIPGFDSYAPVDLAKGKPFATVQVIAPTPLSVVTGPMTNFDGTVTITPFGVHAFDNSHIYFTLSVVNLDSNVNWNSGQNINDPTRYTPYPEYGLKGFVHAEIEDQQHNVVAVYDPIITDAYGTLPVYNPALFPYRESSTFDGYWIGSGWVNLTSDNNARDGQGNQTPGFLIPVSLVDGSYTLFVTVDGAIVVSDPFTLASGTVLSPSDFRVKK